MQNVTLVLLCALAGFFGGLISRDVGPAHAKDDGRQVADLIECKGLRVLAPDGKVAVAIGANEAGRGIWVNGFGGHGVAALYAAQDTNGTPALGIGGKEVTDRKARGYPFAVSIDHDQRPRIQVAGKDGKLVFLDPADLTK